MDFTFSILCYSFTEKLDFEALCDPFKIQCGPKRHINSFQIIFRVWKKVVLGKKAPVGLIPGHAWDSVLLLEAYVDVI